MPTPEKPFADALHDLLAQYEDMSFDELIDELELAVEELRNEAEGEDC